MLRLRLLLLALVALLAACSRTPTEPEGQGGPGATTSPDARLAGVIEDEGSVVFRMREVGPAGQVPVEVAIQLRRPLFAGDQVGLPAPEGTRLVVQPETMGVLRVTGPDALSFLPDEGFRPATKYSVALEAVGTAEASVRPSAPGEWTREFETPAFGLRRAALHDRDLKTRRVEVDLVFTAPVDAAEVRSRATFSFQGAPVRPVSWEAGDRAEDVRVGFDGPAMMADGTLSFELDAGVPFRDDGAFQAVKAAGTVRLAAGKLVEVQALLVREGRSGHYVDIVCNDDAGGEKRWWWDPDSWDGWWVSSRCMLSEDEARQSVHVSPSVEFSLAEAPAGFRLFGDFTRGTYELRIDAGARTLDGGVLPSVFVSELSVPRRAPRLSFAEQGRYLPRSAWKRLAVRHLNVDEAKLTVRHVPPANLVFWLSGDEAASERTSDIVLQQDLPLGGTEDEEETAWLDVSMMLPAVRRGVYELTLASEDGARATSRILLTDLQLVAKRGTWEGAPAVWVWAMDAHTSAPTSGVQVELVRPSGRVVGECRTSAEGGCRITAPAEPVDTTEPVALIARKGDDLTYLKFEDLRLSSDADVQGAPYGGDASYRAAVWTDRGVYRPGDVAHVAALLRDQGNVAPAATMPVLARLFDPRGRELRRKVLETNAAGVVAHDFSFGDFAVTGRYRVVAEVAGNQVGEVSFNVEEFVPERLAVQAAGTGEGHLVTDAVPVEIGARWLFGGGAGGSRYEVGCQVEAATFHPLANAEYHYGLSQVDGRRSRPLTLGTVTGRLDEDGKATVTCPASDVGGGSLGAAELVAQVAVFEGDSGRTTSATARVAVHPAPYYIGTRANAERAKAGQTVRVDGVIVDWAGALASKDAPRELSVEIVRLEEEYGWYWDEDGGDSRYQRLLRRATEDRFTTPVSNGRFTLEFRPQQNGAGHIVVFSSGDARSEQYLEGEGGRYWWDPGETSVDQTPRPQRPRPLAVSAPDTVRVGDRVAVSITAPFAGRVLFSAETDGVLEQKWMQVEAGKVDWSFALREFAPNVYVTAFLAKDPHLESQAAWMPDRAFGVRSVRVEPTSYLQEVKLDVPEVIGPYSELEIGLAVTPTGANTVATVAVVDEGILQLTRFESPDPAASIFARRALGVDSFETIGWSILVPGGGPSSRSGGDADGGSSGRVQMVRPVALWSGVVELPASGKTTLKLPIPGYRGKVRVMAVTASADRMGHAEATVVVRDPLVLQTTLPRFLVGGDIAQVPVFVSNMSGAHREVLVQLEAEDIGPAPTARAGAADGDVVQFLGASQGKLSLDDGASGTVVFQVSAARVPGAARFRVVASADGLRSKEELDLPLVPAQPEARIVRRVALTGGSADLADTVDGWLPGSDHTTVWVTANPYAEALTHLRYLVRYPYGCVEQTTSGTRPLLYVSTLLDGIDPALARESSVDDMVRHGLDRVLSMQTPSGGFGYWPGDTDPTPWATAYATHLLLDAREAGYAVPDESLASAVDYLDRQASSRVDFTDDVYSARSTAYNHYVLARAGKGRPAQAARVLEQLDKAAADPKASPWTRDRKAEHRYLLMAALQLAGDHSYEAELKKLDDSALTTVRENDWTFYSDLRRRGLQLAVFGDLFGSDPAGDALAGVVAGGLSRHPSRWYTTQELSWGIAGLGKRVMKSTRAIGEAHLKVDGSDAKAVAEGGNEGPGWVWNVARASTARSLTVQARSTDGSPVYALVTTEGVREHSDLPFGGVGLRLERQYLTATGKPLDPDRHRLGDPVYVSVTIANTSGEQVDNIALVDRIPAGWEIENPRLGRASMPDWVDPDLLWLAEHMNLRDDRLEVFGKLDAGEERRVVYVVRAVTAGTFTQPDVAAEAMYDPEVWARQPGQVITVQGPWAGFLL